MPEFSAHSTAESDRLNSLFALLIGVADLILTTSVAVDVALFTAVDNVATMTGALTWSDWGSFRVVVKSAFLILPSLKSQCRHVAGVLSFAAILGEAAGRIPMVLSRQ